MDQRIFRILLPILAFFVLGGCKSFAATVQPPPTYDDKCQPQPSFWMDYALDTQDLAPEGYIPADPEEALAKAHAEIEKLGLRLVKKQKTGIEGIDGFSMTLPDTILLADDWDTKSVPSRAEILWHEIVHKRQWDRLDREGFLARYIVTAGKWSLEVPAYRESYRVQKLFGVSEAQMRKNIERRATSLYDKYLLGASMPECTKQTSIEIWSLDLQ